MRKVAYIWLAIGIALLVAALVSYQGEKAILVNWLEVEAEVTGCAVVVSSKRIANTGKWHAECGFRYTVGGREYASAASVASARATNAGRSGYPEKDRNRIWVEDQARQHEPGMRRRIHYDPVDPERIIVDPGISWGAIAVFTFIGNLFAGIGVLILVLRRRATPMEE